MLKKTAYFTLLLGILGAALFGDRPVELRFLAPQPLNTLNSYLYTGGMYQQVFMGLKEGLVEFTPEGGYQPAQAERWEVSDDGLAYTFYLRRDNLWYDGSSVTAWDYRAAFLYQLEPGRESKWSWDSPLQYVAGAIEYREGAATADELGIDVLDDFTLRFRLTVPYPAFLNAMVTGSMFPLHRGSLEKYGEDWHKLENFQGNGPFRLVELELNSHLVLERNPNFNRARGNVERVFCAFSGKPLEAYQSNEFDFVKIDSLGDVYYAKQDPVLKNELVFTPTSGLTFLSFLNSANTVFWDPRVRRAVAMGFDKHRLVNAVYLGTEIPVDMLSSPVMPDWSEDIGNRYDVEKARALLAEAGYPGGRGIPEAVFLFPSYKASHTVSEFVAIAAMLEENLGIRFRMDNQETGIYSEKAYDLLNPEDYFGLSFTASGAPWANPIKATEFADSIPWTTDFPTYSKWVENLRLSVKILAGLVEVEGGDRIEDFERLNDKIKSFEKPVMALYANGRHGPHLRKLAADMIKGWIDAGDRMVAEARKNGADREKLWRRINGTVIRVENYYFQLAHKSEFSWHVDELREEALHTRDARRQAEINAGIHRILLQDSRYIPLRVMNSAALVKPYVKGAAFCPFWWGNPLYLKWISIEHDRPGGLAKVENR